MALAMGKTVGQLLREVSSEELTQWMAFDKLEPVGAPAGYWQAATICCLLANIHSKKGQRPYNVEDFFNPTVFGFPTGWKRPGKQQQSVEDMKQVLSQIHKASMKANRGKAPIGPRTPNRRRG